MTQYAILSRKGERPLNEDAVEALQCGDKQLFILCDGLGGHGGGEAASAITVAAARETLNSTALSGEALLTQCLQAAQTALLQEQRRLCAADKLKTTAVLLLFENGTAQWAHVGDSRLYLFQRHRVLQRTLDHSVPQMLVLQGEIKESQIRFHEDRNRLTRVLGADEATPRAALGQPFPLASGLRFLLCSDGFWEWLDEKEMERCSKRTQTPEAWLTAMEEKILRAGKGNGMDNYSAVAVFTDGNA